MNCRYGNRYSIVSEERLFVLHCIILCDKQWPRRLDADHFYCLVHFAWQLYQGPVLPWYRYMILRTPRMVSWDISLSFSLASLQSFTHSHHCKLLQIIFFFFIIILASIIYRTIPWIIASEIFLLHQKGMWKSLW